jgi:hypothetical protein
MSVPGTPNADTGALRPQEPQSPEAWAGTAAAACEAVKTALEPRLKRVGESLYEDLLCTVQDYLLDNVIYNVRQQIAAADRQANLDRQRAATAERANEASQGVMRRVARLLAEADISEPSRLVDARDMLLEALSKAEAV